jgi:hypothetical protein
MTPTQFASIERSKRFHAKIAQNARPDTPIKLHRAERRPMHLLAEPPTLAPVPEPVVTDEMIEEWTKRQKLISGTLLPVNGVLLVVKESALPKVEFIQKVVCHHFNLVRRDLLSGRRTADVVYPRQVAMFLCKEFTKRSLPEIGRRFGGRDHTTVLHSIRKIEAAEKTKAKVAADLKAIRDQIRSEHS